MIQEDLNEPTQDMQIPNLFGKICREVNRKLAAGALSEQILDYVFDSISIFIPFDRMGIALLENEGQKLRLSWVRSKMAFSHIVENYSASITGSSLQNVIETGEPRILNDLVKYLAEHPNSQSTKLILEDGIRSSLTCPLYERNRPVGIVFFSSANPNTYKQEHVETFQDISNELAIVIEHGRLRNFFDAKKKESLPVARVIHDLRSPLSIIQAYLDLTSRESWFESLNPDVKKMLSTLQRNSNYMVQMLNEMAEIKQLNEKRPNEGKEEIPLQSFLQEMIGYGQALARQKEIGFISDIQNSLPTSARLNAMHIRRILDNLFSNAIKFS
ncbi:MAG: sensor histidine kinase, partial [Bdellovibrionota bacterium]